MQNETCKISDKSLLYYVSVIQPCLMKQLYNNLARCRNLIDFRNVLKCMEVQVERRYQVMSLKICRTQIACKVRLHVMSDYMLGRLYSRRQLFISTKHPHLPPL